DACRDKSARTSSPRLTACERIAATRADRAVVPALKNEGGSVLERAAVDTDLEHADIKAVLKVIIMTESKNAVLKDRNRHRRRIESLVADSGWIINPRSVWEC